MSGLPRGSLTRELLVRESLRLLDSGGVAGFSLPKLGRALGADPTAIYRHFASKDDLVLAIAEAMIEEGLRGIELAECWVETLRDISGPRATERQIGDAEARYRTLVEQLPASVFITAAEEGSRVLYMSPYHEELTGYPLERFIEASRA